jgi:twitching motility two-component system response regulator PilH
MAKKIMIVEDEIDIRTPVEEVLKRNGYEVVTAVSADDCLKKVQAGEKPDLILMDIIMPGTAVGEIVPKLGKIKIVYLTVVKTTEAEKAELMKNKNIVDFIQKPFVLSELIKRVKKLVG